MTTQIVPQDQNGFRPSEPPVQPPTLESPPRKRKSHLPKFILGGLLIAGIVASAWYFFPRTKPTGIELSGRIEGYETDIGAQIPGRVNFVAVREGDKVNKGQLIAQLDDAEIKAQLVGAQARIKASQQQVEQARWQISVIESNIEEAQLNLLQAKGDTQGKISQAQSAVAAAEAQLSEAKAQLNSAISQAKLAKINRDRASQLRQEGAFSQRQLDEAQTTLETAQATVTAHQSSVNAALKQVNVAQGALLQAQTTSFNPDIRTTKIAALQKQLTIAKSQLKATQAEVENAKAAEKQILAQLDYLKVLSPIDGVVTARSVEPGAVVGSGRTLLTVINPNTVYLRGYIPEGEIGKVKVGQPAKILLDSHPNQPLNAQVGAIDTQASFTPENIYFKKDRVEQVFGVKLSIDNPGGYAKPGMPADAEINTKS